MNKLHFFCSTQLFSAALFLGIISLTLRLTFPANRHSEMFRCADVICSVVHMEKLNVGSITAARFSCSTAKSIAFRSSYSVATRHATAGFQREGHKSISNNITWLVTTLFSA